MHDDTEACATVGCEGFAGAKHGLCDDCAGRKKKGMARRCFVPGCFDGGRGMLCEHLRVAALWQTWAAVAGGSVGMEHPMPIKLSLSRQALKVLAALGRDCESTRDGYSLELHVYPDGLQIVAPEHPTFIATLKACRIDLLQEEVEDAA